MSENSAEDIDAAPEPDVDAATKPDIDAAAPDVDAAPDRAPDLIVDGVTEQLESGRYDYSSVQVVNGGVLIVSGTVEINATSVVVDETSQIDGVGRGYGSGLGPGTGSALDGSGAGGGAHGGDGGRGGSIGATAAGGSRYGSQTSNAIDMGSGGGGSGGAGGAAVRISAAMISVRGALRADGSDSGRSSGGGGGGGGILLLGDFVSLTGTLGARGGNGFTPPFSGTRPGGGGGGGRIKVFWGTKCACDEATFDISPGGPEPSSSGASAAPGSTGSTHVAQQPYAPN